MIDSTPSVQSPRATVRSSFHPAGQPAGPAAVDPAPRWAELAAKAAVWSTVPSGLWRVAFACGATMGFSGEALAFLHRAVPGWGSVYMLALSTLAECLAFLTLGLVRPWGRVVPGWIPLIGGRTVRPLAAIVPAALGALVLTAGGIQGVLGWNDPGNMGNPDAPHGFAGLVMTLAYLPLVAWGPLLAAVTFDYARRTLRRR
ncbi:hypothetical protein [Kitasatospora sp. NPDC093806]|uniref:hypothetical protein n=1 Tax=Kitasatospora sp. NPDC093806 TaxID=3155075 RepID=UPI0034410841